MKPGRRSLLIVGVAFLAALISHVAIDVLGDSLLAHDTYDDIGHSSRSLVALMTLGLVLLFAAAGMRAAVREARGSENALCQALRRALPAHVPRFLFAALATAVAILCAMEASDAFLAGQRIDDVDDLLGGSILLGGTVITVVTGVVGTLVLALLRRLAQARHFAGVVVAFLRRWFAPVASTQRRLAVGHRLVFRLCRRSRRIAGRAPPSRSVSAC